MKAIGVGIGLIFLAFLLYLFMPQITAGAHTIQTATVSQTFAGVITTSGTVATVTLTDEAWKGRIGSIGAISGGAGDTPVASALAANGLALTVGGLATSATRALTVAYATDALTDYTGLSTAISASPVLVFLFGLGIGVYGGYNEMKKH